MYRHAMATSITSILSPPFLWLVYLVSLLPFFASFLCLHILVKISMLTPELDIAFILIKYDMHIASELKVNFKVLQFLNKILLGMIL